MKPTTTNKKKVLFFIPEFPVLTETFIEREVVKLIERDNLEIEVFSLKGENKDLSDELKDKVLYKNLTIPRVFFSIPFFLTHIPGILSSYKLLKDSKRSFIGKMYLLLKSVAFARLVSERCPSFIFAHFLSESSTIAMLISEIIDVPFGISAHAKDVMVYPELVSEKVVKAEFVLVCNKNVYGYLQNKIKVKDSKKIHLQYHGVDFEKFKSLDFSGIEKPNKPLILNIGRLSEKKGHKFLIEASKILKQRGVGHLVYIIGPGPLFQELTSLIKNEGLEDSIKILGKGEGLPFLEAVKYYKIAGVFAFPGIKTDEGDEDGVPNAIVEAAALGIPLVVTDAGSSTDLVQNEETGLVVPQKDAFLLADALEKLIFNKELAGKLANNAYNKALEMFDIDKNIVKIEDLIK